MSNPIREASRRRRVMVFCGWACLALVGVRASPADDKPSSAEDLIATIRTELIETQSRLQTGVYRAKGKVETIPPGEEPDGELSIFCAFDNPKRKLRFDGTHPVRQFRDKDDPSKEPDPGRVMLDGGKTLFLPDQTVRWHFQPNNMVSIQRPRPADEQDPRGIPQPLDGMVRPFHINALGLGSHYELTLGRSFEECVAVISRPPANVDLLEERFYRCRWEKAFPQPKGAAIRLPSIMMELTFDTGSGFRPVRFAQYQGKNQEGEWATPTRTVEVKWIERGGTWVPAQANFEDRDQRAKRGTKRVLDFEWESVNQPVDEEHFTLTGLNISREALIVDERGEVPKTVRQ